MASNVFLVPVDSPNFDRTVDEGIDLDEFPDPPSFFEDMDQVRFWGARDGSRNRDYFEKMESRDLVLFYQDGNYIGTGWVGCKFEDENNWASTTFWQSAPSNLIYTIEDFHRVQVPRAAVNKIFDYESDYNPQGLTRVADTRVERRPKVIARAIQMYSEKHN
jgi:hypothetical protein